MNALMDKFQSWYFCKSSMHYIAKKYEFFTSFKEICDSLKEWVEAEKNRRNFVNIDQNEYKTDRFKRLSETDQMLVKIFRINQSKNGDLSIDDWVRGRTFTTVFDYHMTVNGTLKAATFILPSETFTTLPTSADNPRTQYFCTDAYSKLNPQKAKGIIVVWNGSKWVDALGSDIATI